MEQDAYNALMMAFSTIVFVMALSITMVMITKVTTTSEILAFYDDETNYYDNIEFDSDFTGIKEGTTEREVDFDTLSAVLYRYYKENFCVKIYDATGVNKNNPKLLQVFDVNLEGLVHTAVSDSNANKDGYIIGTTNPQNDYLKALEHLENYSLVKTYNNKDCPYYMFGAPWLGSTDNQDQKLRIDYYLSAKAGYINGYRVDYTVNRITGSKGNILYSKMVTEKDTHKLVERFASYSYTGTSYETDEGDTLVTGGKASKDKILITYTIYDK